MSYVATSSATPADTYVDIVGAHRVLQEMGFKSATERKVRRWADDHVLPFFKELGERHISVDVLQSTVRKMQIEAQCGGRKL